MWSLYTLQIANTHSLFTTGCHGGKELRKDYNLPFSFLKVCLKNEINLINYNIIMGT